MTSAQWLFEYMSLREKEKEDNELIIQVMKALRQVLVSVLGLDLLSKIKRSKAGDEEIEDDDDAFIPMSLLAGRREVIEHLIEEMQREEVSKEAIDDDEFEKMSQAIASGEDLGDMSPLFEVDEALNEKLTEWFTPGREQELRALGVKIVEDRVGGDIAHVDIDKETIQQKKVQHAIELQQAKQQVEEQIKEEKARFKQRGAKVTFDDA